jgi:hypothetical protein
VAIEAAIFVTSGQIVAVEQNSERIAQIHDNAKNFGVDHIRIVQAEYFRKEFKIFLIRIVFLSVEEEKTWSNIGSRFSRGFFLMVGWWSIRWFWKPCPLPWPLLASWVLLTDVVQVQISQGEAMSSGTRFAREIRLPR